MKYEAPELNALTAINAIQSSQTKGVRAVLDSTHMNEVAGSYADWE